MTVSEEAEATTVVPIESARARRPLHPILLLSGALLSAWVVPALAYAAGAAVVLPFVFLALVASLVRSGHSVLDRLVIAFALTAGALCAAALLFSVWPWGLHPVPVAGLGFTVVILCAAATGRRPGIPGLGGLPTLFTVGIAGFTSALVLWPLLGRGFTGRLAHVVVAEDLARHFAIFEGIRSASGYNFLHGSEVGTILTKDLYAYPQGSHFGLALFDNFLRSATDMGTAQGSLDRFVFYYAATFMFMIVAILWAIRWLAGSEIAPWRYLAVAGSTAAYLYFGDGTSMFLHGFLSEFAGLGLLAVLVALVVRPLARLREQLCVTAALIISIAYTYYLFLPVAGVMVLIWVYTRRTALRAALPWVIGTTIATGVFSAVLPLANWAQASNAEAINAPGGISPVNRHLLVLLMFVLGLSLSSRAAWHRPEQRAAALWVLGAGGAALLMYLYQTAVVGETSYYYEKLLHQLIVVGLVCLGATGLVRGQQAPQGPRAAFARPLPAVVLTGCLVMAFVYNAGPDREAGRKPADDRAWGTAYFIGQTDDPAFAHLVIDAVQGVAKTGDRDTVNFLQVRGGRAGNYYGTLWMDVLERNLGTAWRVNPIERKLQTYDKLKQRITRDFADRRIRILTDDVEVFDSVQRLRVEYPALGVELLFSNPTRCTYRFEPVPAPAGIAGPSIPVVVPFPDNGCKVPTPPPVLTPPQGPVPPRS